LEYKESWRALHVVVVIVSVPRKETRRTPKTNVFFSSCFRDVKKKTTRWGEEEEEEEEVESFAAAAAAAAIAK
jgi:hypothetical protein